MKYKYEDVAPTPWETNVETANHGVQIRVIFDNEDHIIHFDCDHDSLCDTNWLHAIACVNKMPLVLKTLLALRDWCADGDLHGETFDLLLQCEEAIQGFMGYEPMFYGYQDDQPYKD